MARLLAFLLVAILITLLTGIPYALEGSTPIVNIVVGGIYFLGIYSLYLMYKSRDYKSRERRNLMLAGGYMGLMLAYFCLEMMLWLGIR